MAERRDPTRRDVVLQTGAAALAWPMAASAQESAPLTRIAFGSCARQNKEQPIWDAIAAAQPGLFVFLGDNIYGDTRDPAELRAKYAQLAEKPGFQRVRAQTPIRAIWDDHDYGENDAGGDYPMKAESREAFCDFWNEPAGGARRTQEGGIYASYLFGPPGRRVQLILPDLRWNRTPLISTSRNWVRYTAWALQRRLRGKEIPGPYRANPDPAATMIGDTQWRWLEAQFAEPADLRIIGSSIQVLAQKPGWEEWGNFPVDQARLLSLIGNQSNVVLISGDVHYGELSRLDRAGAAPLWECTSSGLTEVWPVLPPNERRVGVYRDRNFGLIDIDWTARRVTMRVCDEEGAERLAQETAL